MAPLAAVGADPNAEGLVTPSVLGEGVELADGLVEIVGMNDVEDAAAVAVVVRVPEDPLVGRACVEHTSGHVDHRDDVVGVAEQMAEAGDVALGASLLGDVEERDHEAAVAVGFGDARHAKEDPPPVRPPPTDDLTEDR